MCTDDTRAIDDTIPSEPGGEMPARAAAESPRTSPWHRRTLLKAAVLSTAAYGLLGKLNVASAAPITGVNCTANDVRISGPGVVINEPCTCTGTFDAQVRFRLINNTGTDRYCVTIHLCGATTSAGTAIPARDIVIGTVGPGTHDLIATIPGYPCGAGTVCFGSAGSGEDGGFAKGETCPAGTCCTVISWNVRPNDPCPLPHENIIKSKCRAQQVCIVGRGSTTLDCDTAAMGTQTSCAVPCGGTTTLRLCTTSPASFGPFTFALGGQSFGPTTDTCHDFVVGPITETTTFTGTVTDASGCARSASATLTTSPITVQLEMGGGATCGSGDLTFTASTGRTGCTYDFAIDGVSVRNTTASTLSYPADPDGACHTISVVATCGGCVSNTASLTVSQCVTTTTGC